MAQNTKNDQKMVIYRRVRGKIVPMKVNRRQLATGVGGGVLSAGAGTGLAYAAGKRSLRSLEG